MPTGLWRWKSGPPRFYSLPGESDGVQALSEDADGTLLVGWHGGIYRFADGKTEPYPLQGNPGRFEALAILRDHNGGLWIGTKTQGVVHVHQGRTDVFSRSDGLSGEAVYRFFEDREGNVWAATNGGLDRFRDFAVATFSTNQGLSNSLVSSVLADLDGSVWIATSSGLNRWKNGRITAYDKRDGKLGGLAPDSLFQDDRGRIWVSTNHEFGYLENDRFIPVSGIPGGIVHCVAEDTAKNLWIANQDHGLIRLSAHGEVQQIPWASLGHKDFASALAADPSRGGLWLGFFNGGVVYFADGQVRASYTAADGLGDGQVAHFRFDPDGTVWAATQGGLSRLKNGRIATLTTNNGLPCDGVHWVIQDNDHSFWRYTPCGLVRIRGSELDAWASAVDKDKNTKQKIQVTVFDSLDGVRSIAIPGGYTPQVTRSTDGKLWFATLDGVSVIVRAICPSTKFRRRCTSSKSLQITRATL